MTTEDPEGMLPEKVQLPRCSVFPPRLPGRWPVSAEGIQYMNAGRRFALYPAFWFREEYNTFRESKQEWNY